MTRSRASASFFFACCMRDSLSRRSRLSRSRCLSASFASRAPPRLSRSLPPPPSRSLPRSSFLADRATLPDERGGLRRLPRSCRRPPPRPDSRASLRSAALPWWRLRLLRRSALLRSLGFSLPLASCLSRLSSVCRALSRALASSTSRRIAPSVVTSVLITEPSMSCPLTSAARTLADSGVSMLTTAHLGPAPGRKPYRFTSLMPSELLNRLNHAKPFALSGRLRTATILSSLPWASLPAADGCASEAPPPAAAAAFSRAARSFCSLSSVSPASLPLCEPASWDPASSSVLSDLSELRLTLRPRSPSPSSLPSGGSKSAAASSARPMSPVSSAKAGMPTLRECCSQLGSLAYACRKGRL